MKRNITIVLKVGGTILTFIIVINFIKIYFFSRLFYKPQIARVTIPEGWRSEDIAKLLEKSKVIESENFLRYLKLDYSQEFDFLKDKPKNISLEGYLFPDTYEFWQNEKPENVVKKFLINFDNKINNQLRQEVKRQNKNLHQVVVMASILEKEAQTVKDKKIIAGILWKRLDINMPLEVDATYVFGGFDSYKNKGLPLKPISNPGFDSILASIYPQETDFWFYFSSNGDIIFSRNYREHLLKRFEFESK